MTSGTAIGRVRGLGSSHEGTHHWLHQRITAGSNLALMLWFMVSIALLPGYSLEIARDWIASTWTAVPLILLIISVVYHFRLGLQVVIEDYQKGESRVILMVLLNYFSVAVATTAIFAILKIAFTAGAA
ncbi:succinate dehydrogenase, hydrophobic membrane anchor protein [Nostoc sp. 3335mG]|jgi:succinate dehydrogenase / fumarate reductase, membrane anchor subunit|nr:succinate dehydrogenase, hydrophobic membrane anchor protein [Nostoc sp. 3335mG]